MRKKVVAMMMAAALVVSTAACGSSGMLKERLTQEVNQQQLLKLQTKINHSYGLTVSLLTVLQENWIRQLLTLTKILTM